MFDALIWLIGKSPILGLTLVFLILVYIGVLIVATKNSLQPFEFSSPIKKFGIDQKDLVPIDKNSTVSS